jgi:hypothetical protein
MRSIFDTGGFIGIEKLYKQDPTGNYDSAISSVSGGAPTFRWTLSNTTAESGGLGSTESGTFTYSDSIIPSYSGSCADFGGSSHVDVINSSLINTGTWTKRSVSFWFNADTIGTFPCIWEEGGGVNWMAIYLSGGLLYANIGEGSTTRGHATASVSTGTTYHCLVTFDLSLGSNNIKIYLNGELVSQASSSVGTDLAAHSGDNNIGYGAARNHEDTNNPYTQYDGKLQDFCYWYEVALTQSDAENIYNAGIDLGYGSGIFNLQAVLESL